MYSSKLYLGTSAQWKFDLLPSNRRIPIKIILTENEEVSSSDNITETEDDLSISKKMEIKN